MLHLASGVSEPELAKHQRLRLHDILVRAARTPGHRSRLVKAGVCDASGALTAAWLQAFTSVEPLERSRVRSNPGLYLADAGAVAYRGITSGTKSETFVYFGDPQWNEVRQRRRDECLSWWGIGPEHPIVNVVSRLLPARPLDVAIGGPLDVDRVLRALSPFGDRAFALRGYPSRISELAVLWSALGSAQRGPAPRAVLCTGEVLYAHQRALIEQAFRAPVVDEYGCHETGAAGFSCPEAGRLHLDGVRCLFEQVGDELVTTDLYNCVLPAVRYLSGDLIRLDGDPCPCGRPGPTGRLLGRKEDRIRIRGQLVPAGAVDLEPLPGIAIYRVRAVGRRGFEVHAVRLPGAADPAGSPQGLVAWANRSLGARVEVSLHELQPAGGSPERGAAASWAHALLEEEWGQGLMGLAPPEGPLAEVARLHQGVLTPHELSNQRGMALEDCVRFEAMLGAPPLGSAADELLAARVLVWASAHRPFPEASRCHAVERGALARLRRAVEVAQGAGLPVEAAIADLEIGRQLLLPPEPPPEGSPPVLGDQRLDALNAHHLLAAIEQAWMAVPSVDRPPALEALRPLLPVVISDARYFAPYFGASLVPALAAMLGRGTPTREPPATTADEFARRWWRFRMALCAGEAPDAALAALRDACADPRQLARWQLEQAYLAVCRRQISDPEPWLELMHDAAPILDAEEAGDEIDLLPWIPLIRQLGPALHRSGFPDLAYEALAASTSPSSRISAFDRLTRTSNIKQAMIE